MNTETEAPEKTELQKLDLTIDVKQTSSCQRHVTVTIPRAEIERYYSRQFDDLMPKAELPGFRVGKAPRKLLEKKFRKQITDQVKGSLLMDSLSQVQDSSTFSAISEPDLDFHQVHIPEEGDLTYEFNIEVRPEFDLPKWQGLSLTRPEHEFSEKEIQEEIAKFSRQFSDLAPIEEPVAVEDFLTCNITSQNEGKVVASEEEVKVQVRKTLSLSDATINDFDKLMVGASAGDKRTAEVQINQFSDNESLRGQKVELEFEILDVKRVTALTADELASKFGMDSGDEIKNMVSESLAKNLQYEQRQTIRNQISETLTQSANWDLPPDLLKRQSKRELERSAMEMRSSNIPEHEVVARVNSMRKDILERTAKVLKEHFILERIAEDEKIEAEPADYEQEILRIATQQRESPRRVRAGLERNGQMDALRNMIIEKKVIDLIIENASINGTKFEMPTEAKRSYAINFFAAGNKSEIPEAKYDGGEAPAIPGLDPNNKGNKQQG